MFDLRTVNIRAAKRIRWHEVEDYLRLGYTFPVHNNNVHDVHTYYGCWVVWLCECSPPILKRPPHHV